MTNKVRQSIDKALVGVCVVLFVLMVLVGTYQIAARYFFHRPSTVSEELLTYSFAWMALFAAAYVFGKRDHMRVGFLADKLPDKVRYLLSILSECLVFLFAAAVECYGGIRIMRLTMSQSTASLGIPMGLVYLAVPLSGGLTAAYAILNLITILGKRGDR